MLYFYINIHSETAVRKLRILIADPDRDFLDSFSELLQNDGNTVTTVFDGTQVVSSVSDHQPDLVILDNNIPRINSSDLTAMLNEMNIPVIIVLGKNPDADLLLGKILAQSYIRLPFFPDELKNRIREISEKKSSAAVLRYKDIEIDAADFVIRPDVRITNEEINIFSQLLNDRKLSGKNVQPYITSLNNKFGALGKKTFIRYVMKEGYRLVSSYE